MNLWSNILDHGLDVNLQTPQQIADFKIAISLIPDNFKEQFRNNLYEAYNRFGNAQSFDHLVDFLLIVEDLFDNPNLNEDQIKELGEIKKAELNQSLDQKKADNKFTTKTQQNFIGNYLDQLLTERKFTVILDYKSHGKQSENPHIEKTPIQKIQANLATTKEQLQGKLGKDFIINENFLEDLVEEISHQLIPIKRGRTAGSHYGNLVPKILPDSVSPLSDQEKKYYREHLANLEMQYLQQQTSQARS